VIDDRRWYACLLRNGESLCAWIVADDSSNCRWQSALKQRLHIGAAPGNQQNDFFQDVLQRNGSEILTALA
jgi:uncharacterized protein CbrC (UPF0167 family)